MTIQQTCYNGIAGLLASTASVITTFQQQLEWWVRISGGMIGLLIALVTLVRLLRDKKPAP